MGWLGDRENKEEVQSNKREGEPWGGQNLEAGLGICSLFFSRESLVFCEQKSDSLMVKSKSTLSLFCKERRERIAHGRSVPPFFCPRAKCSLSLFFKERPEGFAHDLLVCSQKLSDAIEFYFIFSQCFLTVFHCFPLLCPRAVNGSRSLLSERASSQPWLNRSKTNRKQKQETGGLGDRRCKYSIMVIMEYL